MLTWYIVSSFWRIWDVILSVSGFAVHEMENLQLRKIKGTTGIEARFLDIFCGNHKKVYIISNVAICRISNGSDVR